MAQDFHGLFPLNDNDKELNDADLHGVELAAIKGLNQKLDDRCQKLENENAELKAKNDSLARRLNELATEVKAIAEKNGDAQ
jgi:peptidoglycan hydrolase CwlO-like protein